MKNYIVEVRTEHAPSFGRTYYVYAQNENDACFTARDHFDNCVQVNSRRAENSEDPEKFDEILGPPPFKLSQ